MTAVITAWWKICRCGHIREVHRHHRSGDDCSLCDCDKFKHGPRRDNDPAVPSTP